ncbi:bifunctional diaminohydroxyphosphoribosylaminopyrimidine deaminase/5-amino-6-(5-phosphoribosylamino)uracil reductase RibD [Mesorhizobium sp. NBSH29]|nr:bifunctional diaminohydroxyphosphoribosylaminopyrimidine deaminase/5-amino-6-(5-phosphoribosylamino)uracil reductase RibD [Mesorhizobium sp. NBSH29]
MAAAIRLSHKHSGRTATNPSVGTLIVRDDGTGPMIVGSGVTAIGGRPHAEAEALAEAGALARGATAYVTLEPCAHHGRTPPCANALATAGVVRVVGAATDPDTRVSGKGYAILRQAGIEVVEGVLAEEAADQMAGYLIRSLKKRPQVILKIALSSDGMVGRSGEGQVAISGPLSRRMVHLMRAQSDAILVGIGTALADDPELTVRLDGLEGRSPVRIVLDRQLRLSPTSKLVQTASRVPVMVAAGIDADPARRMALEAASVKILATDSHEGRIALPEFLEDLAAMGIANLMVEGGPETARAFLDESLVDRIVLFHGVGEIGAGGIVSPLRNTDMPKDFRRLRVAGYCKDRFEEWVRKI